MKNTYITIIVLVILIGGAVFLISLSKKAEAPVGETHTDMTANQNVTQPLTTIPPASSSSGTSTATSKVKEFTVTGQNFSFTPSTISVKKGDKVKIIFKNGDGFHNLIIDEFNVKTK